MMYASPDKEQPIVDKDGVAHKTWPHKYATLFGVCEHCGGPIQCQDMLGDWFHKGTGQVQCAEKRT